MLPLQAMVQGVAFILIEPFKIWSKSHVNPYPTVVNRRSDVKRHKSWDAFAMLLIEKCARCQWRRTRRSSSRKPCSRISARHRARRRATGAILFWMRKRKSYSDDCRQIRRRDRSSQTNPAFDAIQQPPSPRAMLSYSVVTRDLPLAKMEVSLWFLAWFQNADPWLSCSSETSHRRMSRHSLASENVGAYNVTQVRRQSVSHKSNMYTSQSEIHRLSTSINMRTEYQALNLAKENETCPCLTSCLAMFNIYT